MKNFKDYENMIRSLVNEINEKDPNWDWSIQLFDDYLVRINWTYLDYCEEKDNCFTLRLTDPIDKEDNDSFITARTPNDGMIEGYFATEEPDYGWQSSWETVLRAAIEEIAYYAHSRY